MNIHLKEVEVKINKKKKCQIQILIKNFLKIETLMLEIKV